MEVGCQPQLINTISAAVWCCVAHCGTHRSSWVKPSKMAESKEPLMKVKMKSEKDLPTSGSSMPEESPLDLALEVDPHVEIEITESVPRGGTYTKGNSLDLPMSPDYHSHCRNAAHCVRLRVVRSQRGSHCLDVQLKSLGTTSQVRC